VTLQRHPRVSPISRRDVPIPPRFRSQAFSASQRFPGKLEFHGLVSCRNRSWASAFRVFPHDECDRLSTIPTPTQSSTDTWNGPHAPLSPPVSPTPAPRRSRMVPPEAMNSLSAERVDFPVILEDERSNRSVCQLHLPRSHPPRDCDRTTRASSGNPIDPLLAFRPSRDDLPDLDSSTQPGPEGLGAAIDLPIPAACEPKLPDQVRPHRHREAAARPTRWPRPKTGPRRLSTTSQLP